MNTVALSQPQAARAEALVIADALGTVDNLAEAFRAAQWILAQPTQEEREAEAKRAVASAGVVNPTENHIPAIRAIREYTKCSLVEARDLVEKIWPR